MISELPPVINEHSSSSLLYTEHIPGPGTNNNHSKDALEQAISLGSHDPSPQPGQLSPDPLLISPDLSLQEGDITVLRAEISELRSVNSLLVAQVTKSETLISELSEQLDSVKILLAESRTECEEKLEEFEQRALAESQDKLRAEEEDEARLRADEQAKVALEAQYQAELKEKDDQISELRSQQAGYVNTISEMQDEWKEKEKSMVSNLTEAEAVRFLSKGTLKNIDEDAQSEVSESSRYSRDTSFMSQSSRSVYQSQAMPDDVETLQAELLKKNKLAFLIKTKSKKLETKVREAKRECDRSKAHDKVKEKVLAVETELANITAQLRNLSSGKKTDSAPKIDPKYVEEMEQRTAEMEHKITVLTAVEQKYENLMVELQTQNHARCMAEERSEELLIVTDEMREKIERLVEELKVKDSLLCDHMGASAEEEKQLKAMREQYDGQQGEVQHLREMNQKMKEALIHMTEESTKIEQTYKSTMHELENDADELKCENATLNGEIETLGTELTTCWAKIEDLEAQNESYMKMLEELHLELQQRRAGSADVEDLKASLIEVHADKEAVEVERDEALKRNSELIEQLNHYEGQNHMLSAQIKEINALYEDSRTAQEVLKEEKEKLRNILEEMNSKMQFKESDSELHSSKVMDLEQSIHSLTERNKDLAAKNDELQKLLSSAEKDNSKLILELEAELKSVYEDNMNLTDTINDLQDKIDDTKNKLNVSNSDRNELTQKLDSVHNHLNDVLSEHEGCAVDIESKLKQCSTLQEKVSDYSSTIDSLREELNIVMETNSADLEQNEVCIQALQEDVVKLKNELASKAEIESELETLKSELVTLNEGLDEKSSELAELQEAWNSLDQQVLELTDVKDDLGNQVAELTKAKDTLACQVLELTESKTISDKKVVELTEQMSLDVEDKTAKISELESCISSLKSNDSTSSEKLTALETQLTTLELQLSSVKDNEAVLETEIETLKANETTLQDQLTAYETSTNELYTQLNDASYKLEQWCLYNETQQEYIAQLTEQAASNTEQLTERSARVNELELEITTQSDTITEKTDKIAALEAEIVTLQSKMTTLQESTTAQTEAVTKLKAAAKKKIGSLNEEIATLNTQAEALQAENAQYQAITAFRKAKHDEESNSLKAALDQAESEMGEIETKLQAVSTELDDLAAEKAQLLSELEQAQSESSSKIEELESENKTLREVAEQISDSKDADNGAQAELVEKEKVLEEKLQFIEELESEKCDLSGQLDKLSAELTKLQEDLVEANGKIMLSEALLETNQEKHQSLEDIIKSKDDQIKALKADAEASIANIQRLTAASEELKTSNSSLSAANKTLEAGISSLHDRMGEADEMVTDMSSKLEQWYYYDQTQQVTISELQTQCEGYKEQLEKVEQDLTQISDENEAKKSDNDSLTKTVAELNIKLNQLQEETKTEMNINEEKLSDKEKVIVELSQELTESKQQIAEHEQTCEGLRIDLKDSNEKILQGEVTLVELLTSKSELEDRAADLESQLASMTNQKDDLAAEKCATGEKINAQETELLKLAELLEEAKSSTKQVIEEKEVITKKAKNVMKAYKDSKLQVEQLKQSMEARQKKSSSDSQAAQLEQLAKENAELNASKVDMEEQNSLLMSEIENFDLEREIMNSLKQEISELKTKIVEKCDQVLSLEGYLSEATSKNEDLNDKMSSLIAELDQIKTEHGVGQDEIDRITETLEQAQASEQRLTDELLSSAELLTKVQLDCASKDDVISNLSSTIEEKTMLIEKLADDAKTDYNEAISSLQKSQVVEESLSQRLEQVSIELDTSKSDCQAKKGEVDQLSASLQLSENLLEQNTMKIRNMSSEIESLRFHVTSLNEQLAVSKSLENDITNFSQTNDSAPDALQVIFEKARQSDELSQTLNNSENEISELKEKLSFYTRDIEKLVTSTEKMSSVEDENHELRRKLETSERVRNETEQSIELLHHKFEQNFKELAVTKASLATKSKELDDMVSQFHSTINKLAEKEGEINDLKTVISEKESTLRKVQENFDGQIKAFQSTALDDHAQIDYLKKELAHVSSEKQSLEENISEMNAKIMRLVTDNESLASSLRSKTEETGGLQEECDKIMRKLDSAEREYQIIEEQASGKDYLIMELQSQLRTAKSIQLAAKTELEQMANSEEVLALRDALASKESVMLEMNADIERLNFALQQYDEGNTKLSSEFEAERSQLNDQLKEVQNVLENVQSELIVKSERVEHLDGVIQQYRLSMSAEVEKMGLEIYNLEHDIQKVQAEKDELNLMVDSLTTENEALKLSLEQTSTSNDAIKASLDDTAMLKNSLLEVQEKLEEFKTTNSMLEEASLRAEEKNIELLTRYNEQSKELKELKADVSHKGKVLLDKYEERGAEITTLKEEIDKKDEIILEKENILSELQADFRKLSENNSLLNTKIAEFSQNTSKQVLSDQLSAQLNQAISDNAQLTSNNAQLTENNALLSTNNKQLHESIAVFQQRDAMLSDMCQKLQDHSELLAQQIVSLESEKSQLTQTQPDQSTEAITSSLREEVNHLKTSKTKLVAELEQTNSRLSNAALKAETLEKSLYDLTTRYNEQCGVVEKRTNDLTKLTRQYKHLKKRLVNELNARKTVLQDSISGRDRATMEIGERTKRLQEVQNLVVLYQKEREAVQTIIESVQECLQPLKEDLASITQRCDVLEEHHTGSNDLDISRSQLKASAALLETLESKTRDVQCFLSRQQPLPSLPSSSLSRVDLSQYRDSDSISQFSRADSIMSDTISDFGDQSLRSEFSVCSEIPLDNNHNYHPSHTRKSSTTNSVNSDWIAKATPEINRTSTGVLNRLAYSFMGSDNRGRSPSENT